MRNIKTGHSRIRINQELQHLNLKTDDDLKDIEMIKSKKAPGTTSRLYESGVTAFGNSANQTQASGFTQQTIASQLRTGTAAK